MLHSFTGSQHIPWTYNMTVKQDNQSYAHHDKETLPSHQPFLRWKNPTCVKLMNNFISSQPYLERTTVLSNVHNKLQGRMASYSIMKTISSWGEDRKQESFRDTWHWQIAQIGLLLWNVFILNVCVLSSHSQYDCTPLWDALFSYILKRKCLIVVKLFLLVLYPKRQQK